MIYAEPAQASSTALLREGAMTEPFKRLDASEDRRATAIRILLALAEVDPTVSGARLILPDGSVTYLDSTAAQRLAS